MKKLTKIGRLQIKIRMLFIPDGPHGDRKRGKLYEPYLKSCGTNFKIASQAFIFNPNQLSVGNNVYIGFNSYIGQGEVYLEDEVLLGNFVSITATNHLKKNDSFRFGGYSGKPIYIGKGVWVAANSCILSGVKIDDGALIAAGCVVTSDVKANSIYGGVPGKLIGNC